MKKIIVSIFVIGLLLTSSLVIVNATNDEENLIEIRVAIYTDDEENADFYNGYCCTKYFVLALRDYDWKVGDTLYRFIPTLLTTKSINRGELTKENYDLLLYPPDTADEYLIYTGFSRLPKNSIRVKKINEFIEQGGGYFGACGGALIAGGMKNKPDTFLERAMKKSQLGISGFTFHLDMAIPFLTQMVGGEPESVDCMAYVLCSSWNMTNPHVTFSGACLDCPINRDSPIFDDHIEDTRRIRWISAPAFEIPENPDREMMVLAKFPEEEISNNETIQIHHWSYVGGLRGIIKASIRGIKGDGDIHWMETLGVLPMKVYVFVEDWEMTDKIVETHVANKAFLTAEIYPNENKARIVRSSGHPEFKVWWGGHIEEMTDTDHNNLYDGSHHWVDITPFNETVEDEITYNYCIIRRCIAWASQKVPDNDLPPIYGPSQVSDIYPYEQPSNFAIEGNVKTADGTVSVDLYYQHSPNNETLWSNWTSYGIDDDGSDGWSWEFNAPDGTGFYQFYSIRHVEYQGVFETEKVPPGPDAVVRVVN